MALAVGGDLASPNSPSVVSPVHPPSLSLRVLPLSFPTADVTFTLATMLGGIIKEAGKLFASCLSSWRADRMENAFYPLSLLGNKSKCERRLVLLPACVAQTYQVTRAGTRVKLMLIVINTLLLLAQIHTEKPLSVIAQAMIISVLHRKL